MSNALTARLTTYWQQAEVPRALTPPLLSNPLASPLLTSAPPDLPLTLSFTLPSSLPYREGLLMCYASSLTTRRQQVGHAASWSNRSGELSIGGCAYPGAGVGAVVLGPTPAGGLAVVLSGDTQGLLASVCASYVSDCCAIATVMAQVYQVFRDGHG